MLLCPDDRFLQDAKMWQRRAGGNAMTLMYEVIDCERGFNENIGTFDRKWAKMREVVAAIKAATEKYRTEDGRPVISFPVDPPMCCQGRTVFSGYSAEAFEAARDRVQEETNVRVFNRFWPKQTLDEKLEQERDGEEGGKVEAEAKAVDQSHLIEWMMMSVTEQIETQRFADAYVKLCDAVSGR